MLKGKYDFPGIRRAGIAAVNVVLATYSWGAWLLASGFKPVIDIALGFFIEWLANRGLLIINVSAIYVKGEFDQTAFDKAMDEGLEKVKIPGLSDAQKKAIDDEVIDAFRRFTRISAK